MQNLFNISWRFKGFNIPWEKRKLSDLVNSFQYGLGAKSVPYDNKNRYVRITDILETTHSLNESKKVSPEFFNDDYLLRDNDILFSRTGASTGKTYIHSNNNSENAYFAGFLIRLKINNNYDSYFVYQKTLTDEYNNFVRIMSQRSGQPGINSNELGKYKFYIPDNIEEQVKISTTLQFFNKLTLCSIQKIDDLHKLKKFLMQNMFI